MASKDKQIAENEYFQAGLNEATTRHDRAITCSCTTALARVIG